MLTVTTNVLIFSAASASLAFVVRFARVTWNRTGLGWSTMALWTVFTLVLASAAITAIWGVDYLGRNWVRFIVYLLINVVVWTQTWQLYSGQRAAARQERRENENRANLA